MARTYKFALPYQLEGYMVGMGSRILKEQGMYVKLPVELQSKIKDAAASWSPIVITKEDCDSIPDEVWNVIAEMAGLEWTPCEEPKITRPTVPLPQVSVDQEQEVSQEPQKQPRRRRKGFNYNVE